MNLELSQQIFGKILNIKFHQNSSSGSRVVQCGRTDITKLIVAFLNVAKALKSAVGSTVEVGAKNVSGKTINYSRSRCKECKCKDNILKIVGIF